MANILIVDDNRDLAENLAELLGDAGFQAQVYDDPCVAAREFAAGRFHLVLLDLRMPGMNGVELARRIHDVDPALPALAMTAWAADAFQDAAVAAGVHAVVHKPVPVEELLRLVHTLVAGPQGLVVSADAAQARELVHVLLRHGVAARAARSADEARAMVRDRRASVLVVDGELPDGHGQDLLEELCGGGRHCRCFLVAGDAPARLPGCHDVIHVLGRPGAVPALLSALGQDA
ncbi:MAG: response regulator [Deltaproteobacteria bacterium]|nr:response regulator [Deltaproteobacteria bacterium]